MAGPTHPRSDDDLEYLKIQAEQHGLDEGADAIECLLKAEEHKERVDELITEAEDLQAEVDVLKEHLEKPADFDKLGEKVAAIKENIAAAKAHREKSLEFTEEARGYLDGGPQLE